MPPTPEDQSLIVFDGSRKVYAPSSLRVDELGEPLPLGVMVFRGTWAPAEYPVGSVVKRDGRVYVAVQDTSETPTPPDVDYSTDFVGVNYTQSPWAVSELAPTESVSTSSGETIPDRTETTAMRLEGIAQASESGDFHVTLTLDFATTGSISFYDMASTENLWDRGTFEIDGVEQHFATGESPWTLRTYPVAAGTHVFKWRYWGDAGGFAGDFYKVAALETVGSTFGSDHWEALT
jgi:hypothetical protein